MKLLEGEHIQITTEALKAIVGCRVRFVMHRDIDKSGRGYWRYGEGVVKDVYRRNIQFENESWYHFSEFSEIVKIEN